MLYTVSDFVHTYEPDVHLVAGEGGLVRPIREVGILDYELVPGLPQRYQRKNFFQDQLILSTFLYARDSPYLLTEAVRHLVSVGAAGLVVKNVFHLDLPDAALRYANARNFPLMLSTLDGFYFDEVIIEVGMRVRELESLASAQRALDALLDEVNDPTEVERRARAINPSFGEEYGMVYAPLEDDLTPEAAAALEGAYRTSPLASVRNLFTAFDGGVLLAVSGEEVGRRQLGEAAAHLRADVLVDAGSKGVGVSEPHHRLGEFGSCLLEAIHAARMARREGAEMRSYRDLGLLRAVLPHASSAAMTAFSQDILGPLRDFDTENNAALTETLEAYLRCGQSVVGTAERLATHPNTVRYRMGQVAQVTGLDWHQPRQMEQLSLACAIRLAQEVAWKR